MQILYLTEALIALVTCQTVAKSWGVVFQCNSLILKTVRKGQSKTVINIIRNVGPFTSTPETILISTNETGLENIFRNGADPRMPTNNMIFFSPVQKDRILKFKYQGHKHGQLCLTKTVNYLTSHYRPMLKIRVLEQGFYLFKILTKMHRNGKANQ